MTARLGASGDEVSDDVTALIGALMTAGSAPDLPTLLDRLAEFGCELTGAEFAVLALFGRDGSLRQLATHGVDREAIESSGALQDRVGVVGQVLAGTQPVRATIADRALGLPSTHPPVDTFLGAPILVGGRPEGIFYLANRPGGSFTRGQEGLFAAIAGSLTATIEHARGEEESERRRAWLEAAVRVYSVTPAMRREDTLTRLVNSVREVTGSDLVALLDGDTTLEIAAIAGDTGLVAEIVEDLHDVIIEAGRTHRVTTVHRVKGGSTLLIPLRTELAPPGVLLAEHPTGWADLRGIEQDLLAGFSEQAGMAIDRAYAVSQRHQTLLTADRDRIARDLHDLVIQRLFATGLHLQGARAQATDRVRDRIDKTITDLDSSIRDIRSIIFELHHGAQVPLREAVRDVIGEYVPILGFAPVLRFTGPVELSVDSASGDHAVATLREALSNVARHARASSVYIEVEASQDFLTLRISDDGVGLPADYEQNRTGGLVNARQRAKSMGGGIDLMRRQPQGTCLEWWIPVTV